MSEIILDSLPASGYHWIYTAINPSLRSSKESKYSNCAKVGQTGRQTVRERVKQLDGTGSVVSMEVIFTAQVPIEYTDKKIHDELEKLGCKKTRDNREFFTFDSDNPEDWIDLVRKAIQNITNNKNIGREILSLTDPQYRDLEEVFNAYQNGSNTIVAELCPRYGKTPWSLALFSTLNKKYMIVAAYWLGALTSFKKEILKFKQFSDLVYIDSSLPGYEKEIENAIKEEKRVVVGVSLHGDKENDGAIKRRLEYLAKLPNEDKFIVIEEADFGAWRKGQVDLLEYIGTRSEAKVLIATGTNAARASIGYHIDHYIGTTYNDLLMAKNGRRPYYEHYRPKYFNSIFPSRFNMSFVSDIAFYKLPFPKINTKDIEDDDNRPSWNKIINNPKKALGVIKEISEALFNGGSKRYEYMNLFSVLDIGADKFLTTQIWLPEQSRIKQVEEFAEILCGILPEFHIWVLSGNNTTGRESEEDCEKEIAQARAQGKRGIIILSSKLGARSFSIPELDIVILAYDRGSVAQTCQKFSRCLTPNGECKTGHVISLSFDPNRDDKLDVTFLETAHKIAEREGISINDALKNVLRTINIFTMDENGNRVKLESDEYTKKILQLKTLRDIIATTADINSILENNELIENLLRFNGVRKSIEKTDSEKLGKIKKPEESDKTETSLKKQLDNKEIRKIREALSALADEAHLMVFMAPSKHNSIALALKEIEQNKHDFIKEFNVEPTFILKLIEEKIVNRHLIDIQIRILRIKLSEEEDKFWT